MLPLVTTPMRIGLGVGRLALIYIKKIDASALYVGVLCQRCQLKLFPKANRF